jgi:hypothetical protein
MTARLNDLSFCRVTYPPARFDTPFGQSARRFPNPTRGRCGKGAGRLMGVTVFQVKVLVHGGFGFSPLGETGEGFYG